MSNRTAHEPKLPIVWMESSHTYTKHRAQGRFTLWADRASKTYPITNSPPLRPHQRLPLYPRKYTSYQQKPCIVIVGCDVRQSITNEGPLHFTYRARASIHDPNRCSASYLPGDEDGVTCTQGVPVSPAAVNLVVGRISHRLVMGSIRPLPLRRFPKRREILPKYGRAGYILGCREPKAAFPTLRCVVRSRKWNATGESVLLPRIRPRSVGAS